MRPDSHGLVRLAAAAKRLNFSHSSRYQFRGPGLIWYIYSREWPTAIAQRREALSTGSGRRRTIVKRDEPGSASGQSALFGTSARAGLKLLHAAFGPVPELPP